MISTEPAPLPLEQTDTNPRCDRCKCAGHPEQKCPRPACGCLIHRDPQQGELTVLGCVVVLIVLALALLAAGLIGDHLRCQRLETSNSPLAHTYCNGDDAK